MASTSQFLKLPTGSDGSAGGKNPSWAPRFPYPQALQRVKPETSSLGAGAQSGESVDMVMAQVQGGLPEGACGMWAIFLLMLDSCLFLLFLSISVDFC